LDQSGRVGAKSPIFDIFSLVSPQHFAEALRQFPPTVFTPVGDKVVRHSLA